MKIATYMALMAPVFAAVPDYSSWASEESDPLEIDMSKNGYKVKLTHYVKEYTDPADDDNTISEFHGVFEVTDIDTTAWTKGEAFDWNIWFMTPDFETKNEMTKVKLHYQGNEDDTDNWGCNDKQQDDATNNCKLYMDDIEANYGSTGSLKAHFSRLFDFDDGEGLVLDADDMDLKASLNWRDFQGADGEVASNNNPSKGQFVCLKMDRTECPTDDDADGAAYLAGAQVLAASMMMGYLA